ncbi:MAG: hypothetical protein J0I90_06965 [Nitrosospira sp.]|nr:hypothetical protein [Nitrosospira sp.]
MPTAWHPLAIGSDYWQNTLVYRSAVFCRQASAKVPGTEYIIARPAGRTRNPRRTTNIRQACS